MNRHSSNWEPVLQGDLRTQIEDVITEIAADLHAYTAEDHSLRGDLGGGDAGIALFFHYLDKVRPINPYAGTAQRLLERAGETIDSPESSFDLYGGISGIAWTCQHILQFGEDDDTLEEIDAGICRLLAPAGWSAAYDLIKGLVGFGVYGLERWPHGQSREILQRVTDHLLALAVPAEPGRTWLTVPRHGIDGLSQRFPDGYYNCGVAHGVPGVLGMLAACARRGIAQDAALAGMRDGVRWLLHQESVAAQGARFPIVVPLTGTPVPARIAWCYGDLGIAGLLTCTAHILEDRELRDRALAMAHHAGRVDRESDHVVDTPLCHGAAGVAHVFNRIHQMTGDESCRQTAQAWFRRVLEMRTPGHGFGGFQRFRVDGFFADPGFLEGSAGIGLALLAGISDVAPDWDRVMLLSLAES